MEPEKEKLEREIKVLEEARSMMFTPDGLNGVDEVIRDRKSRLAALTRPTIKDGVLGRWVDNEPIDGWVAVTPIIGYHGDKPETKHFEPLTIEELLPTLAQWMPGAVRWRYCDKSHVCIVYNDGYNKDNETHRIPAPPRDDWDQCGGEL